MSENHLTLAELNALPVGTVVRNGSHGCTWERYGLGRQDWSSTGGAKRDRPAVDGRIIRVLYLPGEAL